MYIYKCVLCIYTYIYYIHMCVDICVCLCVYVCMCVYIYISTLHIDMDSSMVIARGKGGWKEVEMGQMGDKWGQKDLALDGECMMHCATDVLLSCRHETCMVLFTNVTPIYSIKNTNINPMRSSTFCNHIF